MRTFEAIDIDPNDFYSHDNTAKEMLSRRTAHLHQLVENTRVSMCATFGRNVIVDVKVWREGYRLLCEAWYDFTPDRLPASKEDIEKGNEINRFNLFTRSIASNTLPE